MLSAFSKQHYSNSNKTFPFYELGRVYSDNEIRNKKIKVARLESDIKKFKTQIKSMGITRPEDMVRLEQVELRQYRLAKKMVARKTRVLEFEKPLLKKMVLSKQLPKVQPTFRDIINYAKKQKKYPLDIVKEFEKLMLSDNRLPFFPNYIIQEAKRLRELDAKFKFANAKNESLYPKYIKRALDNEDEDGHIKKLTDMRLKAFNLKLKTIKENQLNFMKDVVRDHVGAKPNIFTGAFIAKALKFDPKKDKSDKQIKKSQKLNKALTRSVTRPVRRVIRPSISTRSIISRTMVPKAITSLGPVRSTSSGASMLSGDYNNYFSEYDGGLGWNPFNDISKALRNIERTTRKAFRDVQREVEASIKLVARNTIDSGLAKDILPKELQGALSKLTKASIEIMVGKISPERIGNALEAVYMISAVASQSVTWIVDETTGAILASPVGRQLDMYTGGLISSVDRLADLDNAVIDDEKVNPLMVIMDVVKVAAVVSGAGSITGALTNVGQQAATQYVGRQSGLSKTALGRSVLSVASGSMTGGGSIQSLLSKEAKKVVSAEATKQSVKALSPALGKDGATILGTALVGSTTRAYVDPEASFSDVLQTSVVSSTKSVANQKLNTEIKKKTGGLIGLDQVEQLYNLDPNLITKDNARAEIDRVLARAHKRIIDERKKALNVKNRIKYEYDLAKAKISDPDALEKLQAHTQRQIVGETEKLSNKIDNAEKEIDKALDTVKGFDLEEEIQAQKDELAENFAREKEAFESLTMNDVFEQAKQYGPDLLRYLMSQYGPKPSYDKVITQTDLTAYKTWTPTANIYPPKPKRKGLSKGMITGGVALVGAYIVMKD